MSDEKEYSPFTRSGASKRKRLPEFYRFGEKVYYDGSKAWILERTPLYGKLVSEKWVRAPEHDTKH